MVASWFLWAFDYYHTDSVWGNTLDWSGLYIWFVVVILNIVTTIIYL